MTFYEKLDIRFQYPDNWTIREEETSEWPRAVVAESPTGAFWSLHVYPNEQDCQELAEEVIQAMRAEYDSLESLPAGGTDLLQQSISGELVAHDMSFYCLDFVVIARVHCFQAQGRTYLTLSQAEDREFEKLADVFQAMTIGMLRQLEDAQ